MARWLTLAAVPLAVWTSAACVSVVDGHPKAASAGAASPELDSLLLNEGEIATIVGSTSMEVYEIYNDMPSEYNARFSKPECGGALWNTIESTYHDSGYVAVLGKKMSPSDSDGTHDVDEGVVTFNGVDGPPELVASATATWRQCAGEHVTYTNEEGRTSSWTIGTPNSEGDVTTVVSKHHDGWVCSHAITAGHHIVADAYVCGSDVMDVGDQAKTIVTTIASRLAH